MVDSELFVVGVAWIVVLGGVRWRSPWQRHWQVRRTAIQSGEARQPGRE
ncbi:MAG: hypothetical protein JWO74_3706, partial [Solirubrobacterales bacterium]|nr:hypothetical protein [Solirubrobacterales bacterium]